MEEVDVDDKGIQCEGECQYWYHCACLGINDGEYDCLAASDSKWECSKCSSADLPVLNSVDAVDVFHFDFQKNLPTPKLTVGKQFYLRLLWTYVFGKVEVEAVYTPYQWFDHAREAVMNASCRIEVTEMQQSNFRNYRDHLRKQYTERTKDLDNKPLNFSDAVWFNFGVGEKLVDGKQVELEHPNDKAYIQCR